MTGKVVKTIRLFGVPVFSYTKDTDGLTVEEISKKITPGILRAVRSDEKLVESLGEKIGLKLREHIQKALSEAGHG